MDQLLSELEGHFIVLEERTSNDQQLAEQAIAATTETLRKVKGYLAEHPFETEGEQIAFYKHYAPVFYHWLVYYTDVYRLAINLPSNGKELQTQMLQEEIRKAGMFLVEHTELRRYIASGADHLDPLYFVRKENFASYGPDAYAFLIADCPATTPASFRVAHIRATERFLRYLETELSDRNGGTASGERKSPRSGLTWTGPITGLVELVYGLYFSRSLNRGQAEISQIAQALSLIFNREIKGLYKIFWEIRLRKKERAAFLKAMIGNLEQGMDEADERPARL